MNPLGRPLEASGGLGAAVELPSLRMDVAILNRLNLLFIWVLCGQAETLSEELGYARLDSTELPLAFATFKADFPVFIIPITS